MGDFKRATAPYRQRPAAAAAAAAPGSRVLSWKEIVLDCIAGAGPSGLTDEEAQRKLGMNPSTQRPRRVELRRAGKVRDSGARRDTASGKPATVWVAT